MNIVRSWYSDIAEGFTDCIRFVGALVRAIVGAVMAFANHKTP